MEGVTEMGITDLRIGLSDRIDAAHFREEPTIIRNRNKGRPVAALISFAAYEELLTLRAERDHAAKS